jgi:hypothetical protein
MLNHELVRHRYVLINNRSYPLPFFNFVVDEVTAFILPDFFRLPS